MSQVSERRRKPRLKGVTNVDATWITLEDVPGLNNPVKAKVLDLSEVGLGIATPVALPEKQTLKVNGIGRGSLNGSRLARVIRCLADSNGGFMAGLAFEEAQEASQARPEAVPDYYEVLQISPNADPDMIHRVFRLLAQRYHPDNGSTGDEKHFRIVAEAYQVLSDPEKRASYDVNLHAYRQTRWRIFDQRQSAIGKMAEKSKRKGILELLYAARRDDPSKPTMNLHELEDLLGCPREHLEFSLWYLKENALVARADNGRYQITAKGVDHAEEEEAERLRADRLLPSAHTEP